MHSIIVDSPENMRRLGRDLGSLLRAGDVVCLAGPLGAGKTTLAQGIAIGLQVSDQVTSPTFTIVHTYEGRLAFNHVDAYRLERPGEAEDIGLEELLGGGGVTVIEWAENIHPYLPPEYLLIEIEVIDQGLARKVIFRPVGQSISPLVEELKALCEF
ncbi:MAG: tRNA (adenosine(37)-N6)-threonylcarbamoyltransferase complex ATPase subunit type 1 TsaE [Syntrophomonadaceae bacterium]|jgi:tRNA threonylcarbamoyladenosine biosynthesis protein TsaE|nr:tRNA (adenosine(37)-N6)-threonylcarbamoyltransferase complex ATPase subunit type 1 TsaE [Syntrophomonadaceae bacterium]